MSETLEALKGFVKEQERKEDKWKICYYGFHIECPGISGKGGRCSCKCHKVFDTRKMVGPDRDEITNESIVRHFMFPER